MRVQKRYGRALTLVLVVLALPLRAQAVDVKAALDMAVKKSPEVQSAREKLRELEAVESQAYSKIFPVISASGTAQYRKDSAASAGAAFGGEPYNSYKVGFDLSQTLFDGGAMFSAITQAKLEREIRNEELKMAERDLTVRLIQAFYTVLLFDHHADILKKNYEVKKKALATAESRYRIGRGQLLDVLQIKTQVALMEPKISQMESQIEIAAANLASMTGVPAGQMLELEGSLDVPLKKFVDQKTKAGVIPEIQKIYLQQKQLPEIRGVTLAKHYPQVGVAGNWARNTITKSDLLDDHTSSWSLGLQLTIPLFSGLSSFGERKVLASQENQLYIQERKVMDAVSLEQIRAEKEMLLRHTLVNATKKAADIAIESLREAEKNFRLQTTDYLQLLQAQQNHLEAMSSYEQAKYDYILSVAKFYVGTGLSMSEVIDWLKKS